MTALADHPPVISSWLPYRPASAGLRLYCLPHAGGSASIYRSWAGRLPGVAVCPVQPPGRETRRLDTPLTSMDEMAGTLAGVLLADAGDAPYAIYGHSLGGLVGFEVIKEIRRRDGRDPVHLLVSGCAAPQLAADDDPDVRGGGMTDAQILRLLRSLGGTPEEYLSDPRVLRIIMPSLRADLAVKTSYRYRPEPPLDVPITVIAGTHDARASVQSMLGWREQTVRRFRARTLAGGHFAVLEQQEETLGYIGRALRGG